MGAHHTRMPALLHADCSNRPLGSVLVFSTALKRVMLVLASGALDSTVRLWNAQSGAALRTLRPDRLYERMDITGLTGVTAAQREALLALGAVDNMLLPHLLTQRLCCVLLPCCHVLRSHILRR